MLGLNERRKNNKKIHEKNCVYFFMMSYYSGLNFFYENFCSWGA